MSRIALAAALLLSSVAAAEVDFLSRPHGGSPISYEALMAAPLGSWAEYTSTIRGYSTIVVIRYAVVEKTKTRITVEAESRSTVDISDGSKLASKVRLMRMEFEPDGKDAWKLAHAPISYDGSCSQEWKHRTFVPPLRKGDLLGEVIGKVVSIEVPAGKFAGQQYDKKLDQYDANMGLGELDMVIHLWINDTVPPLGLLKQTDDDGELTVLTATGKGAVAKMTAKPCTIRR